LKVLLVSNTSWYLYNFRLPLANALREKGDEVVLVSPVDKYVNKLVDLGFKHLKLTMKRGGVNPVRDLLLLGQLFRIYKNEKPDLVHHFTSKCVLYGSLAAKMAGMIKVVNSITGMGYVFSGDGIKQRFLQPIVLALYKICLQGTQVIFQNEDDEKEFKQIGMFDVDNLHIIRSSGVDLKLFHPDIKPEGIPIIILAARMLRDKGVFEFVEAARILKERKINSRMVLVGEPDPENPSSIPVGQLKAWAESNMIEWWGWKDDMVSVYSEANIVCLPSYREGLPKSLIEAAASSLPIVTTDTYGCRDVVGDGVNGYLVPVGDSTKLADALQKLIQNPGLRQKMGVLGRKMVERDYDLESVIHETLNVYGLMTAQ